MVELVAILLGSIMLLVLINWNQQRTSRLNRQYYRKKWQEIKVLEKSSAAASRLAVIEADKILDRALKDLGYAGTSMSDRLQQAGSALGDVNAVWTAHKLRNRLVHEETKLKRPDVRRAISAYQAALQRLGAF